MDSGATRAGHRPFDTAARGVRGRPLLALESARQLGHDVSAIAIKEEASSEVEALAPAAIGFLWGNWASGLPGIGLQQDPIEYQSFTWRLPRPKMPAK